MFRCATSTNLSRAIAVMRAISKTDHLPPSETYQPLNHRPLKTSGCFVNYAAVWRRRLLSPSHRSTFDSISLKFNQSAQDLERGSRRQTADCRPCRPYRPPFHNAERLTRACVESCHMRSSATRVLRARLPGSGVIMRRRNSFSKRRYCRCLWDESIHQPFRPVPTI